MKFRFLIFRIAIFILFIGFYKGQACSCLLQSIDESYKNTPTIFSGKAISVWGDTVIFKDENYTFFNQVFVKFAVEHFWKGTYKDTILVTTNGSSAACGVYFIQDSSYLIFGYNSDTVTTNSCTYTRSLSDAAPALRYLNSVTGLKGEIPDAMHLYPNYPNPFNPATTISFYLNKKIKVDLSIYDMQGKKVQTALDEVRSEGLHNVKLTLADRASGIYIVRLTSSGGFVENRKMVLLK